jgi:hypothetical protein
MYELSVEVTYGDVGEATSNGLLNTVMNIIQFLGIMALTPILDWKTEKGVFLAMMILLLIALAGLILSIFSPINYKRTKYQNIQSQLSTSTDL